MSEATYLLAALVLDIGLLDSGLSACDGAGSLRDSKLSAMWIFSK